MRAIILAGGLGTRLAPYTENLPKPMVPVGDQPILELILRQLKAHGCTRVTLAVGHRASALSDHFGAGEKLGLAIDYSHEQTPLGTAGPLALVPDLTESFLVMNGDIVTTLDFSALVAGHRASGAFCTIAVSPRKVPIDLGVVRFDDHHRLTDYVEKPVHVYHASMGIYVFEPRVLEQIEPGRRLDMPDLMRRLIAAGDTVRCHTFEGYWRDVGNERDYLEALADFARLGPLLPGRT